MSLGPLLSVTGAHGALAPSCLTLTLRLPIGQLTKSSVNVCAVLPGYPDAGTGEGLGSAQRPPVV